MSLAEHHDDLIETLSHDELGDAPPDTAIAATAVLRALGSARRRADDAAEVATAQVAQVASWLEALLGVPVDVNITVRHADARPGPGYLGAVATLEERLRMFHAAMLERDPKATTISLPTGTLSSRMGQPSWEVTDELLLLVWAEKELPGIIAPIPEYVPPPPRIDRNALKRELTLRDEKGRVLELGVTPDGETPPGLKVEPAERTFKAQTDDA